MNAIGIVKVQLLGPVALVHDSTQVLVRGQRQVRFVAALALRPGQVVSKETLMAESWDGEPPRTAPGQLQTSAWRVRQALQQAGAPPKALASHGFGYRLLAAPSDVDIFQAREAVRSARKLFGRREYEGAARELDVALEWWRGPALAGISSGRLRHRAEALDAERVAAVELRALIDMELGGFDSAVERLTELIEQEPLREDLYVTLIRAYYSMGRQSDALHTFHRAARQLREQIGVAPGERLRHAMQAVLRQDARAVEEA